MIWDKIERHPKNLKNQSQNSSRKSQKSDHPPGRLIPMFKCFEGMCMMYSLNCQCSCSVKTTWFLLTYYVERASVYAFVKQATFKTALSILDVVPSRETLPLVRGNPQHTNKILQVKLSRLLSADIRKCSKTYLHGKQIFQSNPPQEETEWSSLLHL